MSEETMRELVVIDPEDVFRQCAFSPARIRDALGKIEQQIEEKRLLAWTSHVSDPQNEEAKRAYKQLCREQGKIMTAFNRWRAENPEEAEE